MTQEIMKRVSFGSKSKAQPFEMECTVVEGEETEDILTMIAIGEKDKFYILVNHVTGEMAAQHQEENRKYSIESFTHRVIWEDGKKRQFMSYK
jgi:hypothetical protein